MLWFFLHRGNECVAKIRDEAEMKVLGIDFSCALGALSSGQFPEKDCLLPLISKLLGYAIVAASTTVKLPQQFSPDYEAVSFLFNQVCGPKACDLALQFTVNELWHQHCLEGMVLFEVKILKILEHGSVRGLSVLSFELEVVGYTIALAYCLHGGLPFSAYGELAFLLIQALILVAIIYYYSQPVGTKRWMGALLYCGVAPTILAGRIDPVLFEALYASQHAIFLCAKIPQIWQNFSNKSTGELSFLTNFMNFGGSLVRVFTSIQEEAPKSVLLGSILGIATNATLLSQILLYQKPKPRAEKEKKTK